MLEIKGKVLHRVRLNLKVPGWLSDLNDRKLPMFLWRLNYLKYMFSFGIIAGIVKFLRMTF